VVEGRSKSQDLTLEDLTEIRRVFSRRSACSIGRTCRWSAPGQRRSPEIPRCRIPFSARAEGMSLAKAERAGASWFESANPARQHRSRGTGYVISGLTQRLFRHGRPAPGPGPSAKDKAPARPGLDSPQDDEAVGRGSRHKSRPDVSEGKAPARPGLDSSRSGGAVEGQGKRRDP
jgi:hypothetical protein